MNKKIYFLILTIISIIGILVVLYITRFGAGISPDSIYYISGARTLVNNLEYLDIFGEPMTHWPPLFPFLISVVSRFNMDTVEVARYLNSVVFGLNIFLMGILLYKVTQKSFLFSIFGLLIFASSIDMYLIHRMVWSEPFFIFLLLSWILLYNAYIEKQNIIFLILTAIIGSLLFFQRYIGLFICVVFVLDRILYSKPIIVKLKEIAIYLIISFIAIPGWFLRNNNAAGTVFNKQFSLHSLNLQDIEQLLNTLSQWVLHISPIPSNFKYIFALILITCTIIFSMFFIKKQFGSNSNKFFLSYLLILVSFVYIMHLVLFRVILNAQSVFEVRFLSPIYPTCLLLWVFFIHHFKTKYRYKKIYKLTKNSILFLGMFFLIFHIANARNFCSHQKDGYAYASSKWKNSSLLMISKKLPENYKIYSNLPILVYYIAEKHPYSIYKYPYSKIDFNNSIVILFEGISSRPIILPENKNKLEEIKLKKEGILYCSKEKTELIRSLYENN